MRRFGVAATGGLTIVVVLAAAAWACTALATLNLSASAGRAGAHVNVTGTAFATTGCSPVAIRWDRLDGPVLATVPTDPIGTIRASIVIPADAQLGAHALIATQDCIDDEGVTGPTSSAATRASFKVEAPLFGVSASSATDSSVTAAAGMAPAGSWFSPSSLPLAGFGLVAAGLALFAGRPRRRPVPASIEEQ